MAWILTVSTEFRWQLCGNCAFPKNFYTKNLGEISVFYSVHVMNPKDTISKKYTKKIKKLKWLNGNI